MSQCRYNRPICCFTAAHSVEWVFWRDVWPWARSCLPALQSWLTLISPLNLLVICICFTYLKSWKYFVDYGVAFLVFGLMWDDFSSIKFSACFCLLLYGVWCNCMILWTMQPCLWNLVLITHMCVDCKADKIKGDITNLLDAGPVIRWTSRRHVCHSRSGDEKRLSPQHGVLFPLFSSPVHWRTHAHTPHLAARTHLPLTASTCRLSLYLLKSSRRHLCNS